MVDILLGGVSVRKKGEKVCGDSGGEAVVVVVVVAGDRW